jgi:hypothetical protein
VPTNNLPELSMRMRSVPFVLAVTMFAPVADKAKVPAFVTKGVVTDTAAESPPGDVIPVVPLRTKDISYS